MVSIRASTNSPSACKPNCTGLWTFLGRFHTKCMPLKHGQSLSLASNLCPVGSRKQTLQSSERDAAAYGTLRNSLSPELLLSPQGRLGANFLPSVGLTKPIMPPTLRVGGKIAFVNVHNGINWDIVISLLRRTCGIMGICTKQLGYLL